MPGHRTIGIVGWSITVLLGGLVVYYAWRTASNREGLAARNLRELDRIGASIEGLVRGFTDGVRSVQLKPERWRLVPYLLARPDKCANPEHIGFAARELALCYYIGKDSVGFRFSMDPLEAALRTEQFEATFLADASGRVFLTHASPGLRLYKVPEDTAREADELERVSTVRTVDIGGRPYRLFLQPIDVRPTPLDTTASVTPPPSIAWFVGGLLSTARFRAESLELSPRHLIFLGMLLVLAVLSLPFLRTALLGPWESIKAHDVYLLSICLVLATGVLGIAVADIQFFGTYVTSLNRNLARAGERLAAALHEEIGRNLEELERWSPLGEGESTRIFRRFAEDPQSAEGRYLRFQMLIWIDSTGMQQAKGTPRAANTPLISVAERDYFARLRTASGYEWRPGRSKPSKQYFLESIQSVNTGEKITVLSRPCSAVNTPACNRYPSGVVAMTTRLASLDRPVLPPGVRFAVVRPDGLTILHSDPRRSLGENFLRETGEDARVRALLLARDTGSLRAAYMGHKSRLYVRPIEGTDLALIMVLDESLAGTARFEGIFTSLAVLLAWAFLIWAGFLVVELLVPGRLRWAWPDHARPWKYRMLSRLLAGFAALLVLQAVLSAAFRVPVHPSSLLVPIQALCVALLVQAEGAKQRAAAPRNPSRPIGWTVLALATFAQLLSHFTWSSSPPAYLVALALAQLSVVTLSVLRLASLARVTHEAAVQPPMERWLQPWYVSAIVLTLTIVALLPAYLIHLESATLHRNRLAYFEQVELRRSATERPRRIRELNADRELGTEFDALMARDTYDLAAPPVLAARLADPRAVRGCRSSRSELATDVFAQLERPLPFVTDQAVAMRELDPAAAPLRLETCNRGVVRLVSGDSALAHAVMPPLGPVGAWRFCLLASLLLLGYLLLVHLSRWVGRRVFLLDMPPYQPLTLSAQLARAGRTGLPEASLVAICTRSMDRAPLRHDERIQYVDLLELESRPAELQAVLESAPRHRLLALDHFDHRLDDAQWSGTLLQALENVVLLQGRTVLLFTSREPCDLFPLMEQLGADGQNEAERWIRLLGQFVDVAVAELTPVPTAAGGMAGEGEAETVLAQEANGHRRLENSAAQVERRPDFHALTREGVVEQVREMADSYYHALWTILEHDEKMVVAQLSHGVVVNPKGKRAVRRLLARNVVVREPELRLMNDSFGRFVREEVPASTIQEWEHGMPSSAWQRLRFPIGLALAGVVALLVVTQREFFNSAVAILTASSLGMTALLKLVSAANLGGRGGD